MDSIVNSSTKGLMYYLRDYWDEQGDPSEYFSKIF